MCGGALVHSPPPCQRGRLAKGRPLAAAGSEDFCRRAYEACSGSLEEACSSWCLKSYLQLEGTSLVAFEWKCVNVLCQYGVLAIEIFLADLELHGKWGNRLTAIGLLLFLVLFALVTPYKSSDFIILGGLFGTITLLASLTVLFREFVAGRQTFTFVI